MKRKALLAGNWKMHMNRDEAVSLAQKIAAACGKYDDREVLLAPSYTVLGAVAEAVKGSEIIIAGQNICWQEQGAFTGEISPTQLQDMGGSAAIVGHSERRQIFMESDALVNTRLRGALRFGLNVILCIGETLEQRQAGNTFSVLENQVREGLKDVTADEMDRVVLAYEPVWAIGTGETASKEQAQEVHQALRQLICDMYQKNIAERLQIVYGGSVKATNIDALMSQEDIDGALVGGAALDGDSFARIINFE